MWHHLSTTLPPKKIFPQLPPPPLKCICKAAPFGSSFPSSGPQSSISLETQERCHTGPTPKSSRRTALLFFGSTSLDINCLFLQSSLIFRNKPSNPGQVLGCCDIRVVKDQNVWASSKCIKGTAGWKCLWQHFQKSSSSDLLYQQCSTAADLGKGGEIQLLALKPWCFCSEVQCYQPALYPTRLLLRSPSSGPNKPTGPWIISHHTQQLRALFLRLPHAHLPYSRLFKGFTLPLFHQLQTPMIPFTHKAK